MNYLILIACFLVLSENLADNDNKLSDTDYCGLCDEDGTHTVCKYPKGGAVSSMCKLVQLTRDEKMRLLKVHNKYRQKVAMGNQLEQPSANNMLRLRWDFELEAVAARWAEQCVDDHDNCRNSRRFEVGQNMAWQSSWNLEENVELWFDEVKDFDPDQVDSYVFDINTRYYTQLVWAGTYAVGCARTERVDAVHLGCMLVCNYGPAGNVEGAPVCRRGDSASVCPNGTSPDTDYTGLCAIPGPDFPEQILAPSLRQIASIASALLTPMSLVILLAVGALTADWWTILCAFTSTKIL